MLCAQQQNCSKTHKSNQSMTNQQKISAARKFLIDLRKSRDIKHYMQIDRAKKKEKRYKTIQDQETPSVLTRKLRIRDKYMESLRNQNQCLYNGSLHLKGANTNEMKGNEANIQENCDLSQSNEDEDVLVQRVKRWIDRRSVQLLRNGKIQSAVVGTGRLNSGEDHKRIKEKKKTREIKILQTNNVLRCYSYEKQQNDPEKSQQKQQKTIIQIEGCETNKQREQTDESIEKIRSSYSHTYNLVTKITPKQQKYKKKIILKLKINQMQQHEDQTNTIINQDHHQKQPNNSEEKQKDKGKAKEKEKAKEKVKDQNLTKLRNQTLSQMLSKYGMKLPIKKKSNIEKNSVSQWDYHQGTDYDDNY